MKLDDLLSEIAAIPEMKDCLIKDEEEFFVQYAENGGPIFSHTTAAIFYDGPGARTMLTEIQKTRPNARIVVLEGNEDD